MNAKYADVVSEIQVCDYLRSLVEEH